MALTVTVIKRNVVGAQKEVIADVTFDSSYPSGGEAFIPNDVDKSVPTAAGNVFHWVAITNNDATLADHRLVSYDHTNQKLFMITTLSSGANAEAANASNQSAVTVRVLCRYGQVTG
jgi:hypothetical protein